MNEKRPVSRTPRTLHCGLLLVSLAALALAGCSVSPSLSPPPSADSYRLVEPRAATLPGGDQISVWAQVDAEGEADIVLARREAPSKPWKRLGRLNRRPGSAVAGHQVGPRLATGEAGTGIVAIAWVDRARDPAGDVLVKVSGDGGRSFTRSTEVMATTRKGVAQEYHDIAVAPDGGIWVVWLDERDAPPSSPNQKQLHVAVSRDGGHTFSEERALTRSERGVCPCCRPAIAVGPDGAVHVAFRDRIGEDLVITTRTRRAGADGFDDPVVLSRPWRFPACPANAPAIAAGARGKVWVVWVDASKGRPQLWWSRSDDRARSFGVRATVDSGLTTTTASRLAGGASGIDLETADRFGAVAVWQTPHGDIGAALLPEQGETLDAAPAEVHAGDARSPCIDVRGDVASILWVEVATDSAGGGPNPARTPGGRSFTITRDGLHPLDETPAVVRAR